jgi:hypothetical protein
MRRPLPSGVRPGAMAWIAAFLTVACPRQTSGVPDAGPAVAAAKDLAPPLHPPPLRAPHPTMPPLPDLPTLAAHEPPSQPPPDVDLAAHPCRSVWTGSSVAPLACARAMLFDTADGGAGLIVPRALLRRDPDLLPALVDHRLDRTEGPVRNQASAPACTAFATAAAVDHAIARWSGLPASVSVMQIWSRYHSPRESISLSSNLGQALGGEARWPFDANEATSWVACSEFDRPPRVGCGKVVNDARRRAVEQEVVGHLTEVEFLGVPDVGVLQAKIAAGQDVIVTLELPRTFVPKGRAGARYVPHWTTSAGNDAGHALLLSGYATLPHGKYFLAHNSWGSGWGDAGYAWIHEATLRSWMHEAVAVDAEPVERGAGGRPARARGETTCEGDLVLDSLRGTCAPACPDASPRHDGVCPVAGQCPSRYVNLTGACMLAAPTVSGRDPSTGVSWRCGPGGCSYDLPRASDPTCTGSTCKASCPAPDFHVARMGASLVCVE